MGMGQGIPNLANAQMQMPVPMPMPQPSPARVVTFEADTYIPPDRAGFARTVRGVGNA